MRVGIMTGLLFVSQWIYAQTWSEWMAQKKTQIKYLKAQIAALMVYHDAASKGYQIGKEGLNTIGNIRGDDQAMHDNYFTSLKTLKSSIKNAVSVQVIADIGKRIADEIKEAKAGIRNTSFFTTEEKGEIEKTLQNLSAACLQSLNELKLVMTSYQLAQKDDERLKRIEAIYLAMQSHYNFCGNYLSDLGLQLLQRQSEKTEIDYSRIIRRK